MCGDSGCNGRGGRRGVGRMEERRGCGEMTCSGSGLVELCYHRRGALLEMFVCSGEGINELV